MIQGQILMKPNIQSVIYNILYKYVNMYKSYIGTYHKRKTDFSIDGNNVTNTDFGVTNGC